MLSAIAAATVSMVSVVAIRPELRQTVQSKSFAGRRSIRITMQIVLERLDRADLQGLLTSELGLLDPTFELRLRRARKSDAHAKNTKPTQ